MRRGASSVWEPASDEFRLIVETRVLLAVTVPPALSSMGWIVAGYGLLGVFPDTNDSGSRVGGLHLLGDRPDEATGSASQLGRMTTLHDRSRLNHSRAVGMPRREIASGRGYPLAEARAESKRVNRDWHSA